MTNVKAKIEKKTGVIYLNINSKGVMFEASFVELSLFSSISITIYRTPGCANT